MEFSDNEKMDLVDERLQDTMDQLPAYNMLPYETHQIPISSMMPYEMQRMPMSGMMPYGVQEYPEYNDVYGQQMLPGMMSQYPQNMYRQNSLLPLVLLGLGSYAFGDYDDYYYPPYFNTYYPPYYPPYYNPYPGYYYNHRTD